MSTNTTIIPFEDRVANAAKILNISEKLLTEFLHDNGIDSLDILDSDIVTIDDVARCILDIPIIKCKVAAGILKDTGVKEEKKTEQKSEESSIKALLEANKPIPNWSDEEVLTGYLLTNRDDLEFELQKRAKGRCFIILQKGTQDEVDLEASLKMLKKSRKEEIPSSIVTSDKKLIKIYKIEEYHVGNRIRHESPLRPGVALFDGYCAVSKQNFFNVGEPAKKMLRLIYDVMGKQSRTEENRLVEIAEKEGLNGLGRIFPEVHDNYMTLAQANQLPPLTMIESPKAKPTYRTGSDPFFVNGTYTTDNGNGANTSPSNTFYVRDSKAWDLT